MKMTFHSIWQAMVASGIPLIVTDLCYIRTFSHIIYRDEKTEKKKHNMVEKLKLWPSLMCVHSDGSVLVLVQSQSLVPRGERKQALKLNLVAPWTGFKFRFNEHLYN